ncbi:MAG: hypothetical protein HN738_05180 [Gammaproteobacteria bacterium]|nr:hypothetical protein [Gammaproteobacteria bacterium]
MSKVEVMISVALVIGSTAIADPMGEAVVMTKFITASHIWPSTHCARLTMWPTLSR